MKKNRFIVTMLFWITMVMAEASAQQTVSDTVGNWYSQLKERAYGAGGQSACGHFMDGPAFFAKQTENTVLDRALVLEDKDEMEVGSRYHNEISKESEIVQDHWARKQVEGILQKMLPFVDRRKDMYRISIIDLEEINAFATMGGYIYLTTGILDFVESEDELAFIIGHEMAHIDKYHTQRKYKKLFFAQSFGQILTMESLAKMAVDINQVLFAAFDQPDEYEADKGGVNLMRKAGYDPERSVDFFTKREKYQNRSLLNKLTSTHPFAADRKSCILTYISNN